jgi:hypothetical protein
MNIDHAHESRLIRGLLCTNCNKAIGHFKDDPSLLLRAIAYLNKHQLQCLAV